LRVEKILQSLISNPEKRRHYLAIFVEAIHHANSFGNSKWGVQCRLHNGEDKIRLLVGSLIVCTIEKECLWLALDKKLLVDSSSIDLDKADFWKWDKDDYPLFKSIDSVNGYYLSSDLSGWQQIKHLHFEAIKKAAHKYQHLSKQSQPHHSTEILNYLRSELNQAIPEPVYVVITPENTAVEDIDNHFPEEIQSEGTEKFYEGTLKQITVNAYERDSKARQKCIATYGLNCAVCGFNFEEKYGDIGKGFIHVHHLKPLSDLKIQYELDPITDLRPVCPNCHAMLHRKKPPYSIAELKQFIEKHCASSRNQCN